MIAQVICVGRVRRENEAGKKNHEKKESEDEPDAIGQTECALVQPGRCFLWRGEDGRGEQTRCRR